MAANSFIAFIVRLGFRPRTHQLANAAKAVESRGLIKCWACASGRITIPLLSHMGKVSWDYLDASQFRVLKRV